MWNREAKEEELLWGNEEKTGTTRAEDKEEGLRLHECSGFTMESML